jgi:hypothetical protein
MRGFRIFDHTEKVGDVIRGRGIVSTGGSDAWIKMKSVIKRFQQLADPPDRLDIQFSLQVNTKASTIRAISIAGSLARVPCFP